jgi:hypothetical protein
MLCYLVLIGYEICMVICRNLSARGPLALLIYSGGVGLQDKVFYLVLLQCLVQLVARGAR